MKNRFLLIFISAFVAVVLIVGLALGIAVGVKNAKSVVKYENTAMDMGTLNYLAAYYKMLYINSLRTAGISASDTDSFWNSISSEGKSYGEHLTEGYRQYIASLAVASGLYHENAKYSSEDKKRVSSAVEEILKYRADDSVKKFNKESEKYGFDYKDFSNAASILYKAQMAESVIYGVSGSNISKYTELCDEYFSEYSHVTLLFINTVKDMTEEELEKKQETIDMLKQAIEAKKAGESMQITPETIKIYLPDSDGDPDMHDVGYYFHPNAEKTVEFASQFPEVVKESLSMDLYDYSWVDCSVGVCFIYKWENQAEAYESEDNIFFSDFYSDASVYHFGKSLDALSTEVVFSDRFYEVDIINIPAIKDYYIKEF